MKVFSGMAISASALTAEKVRIDVVSSNLANINTTRSADGQGPYQPRNVKFQEILDQKNTHGRGVQVSSVYKTDREPRMVYQPEHPDANDDGYVAMPNIDVAAEMVDLITATRSYEANVTVLNASKSMAQKALEIGRG